MAFSTVNILHCQYCYVAMVIVTHKHFTLLRWLVARCVQGTKGPSIPLLKSFCPNFPLAQENKKFLLVVEFEVDPMNVFRRSRRRRKTHPCLLFERKASSHGPFPCTSDSVNKKQSEKQTAENESETKHNDSKAILVEQIKESKAIARAAA